MSRIDDFIRRLDIIQNRKWDDIREKWIPFAFKIETPGAYPNDRYYEIPEFEIEARKLKDSTNSNIRFNISGVQGLMLREGIFYLHKASHVIAAAEISTTKGLQTWSLSIAYQGAIFSAHAILFFLGIGFPVIDEKVYLLDLFPKNTSKFKNTLNENISEMELNKIAIVKVEQMHLWATFLRLIRVFKIDDSIWSTAILKEIKKIQIKEFTRQRNYLHYSSNDWLFDDLFNFILNSDFEHRSKNLVNGLEFNIKSDFTLMLSFSLYHLAYSLLKDLSNYTNTLNDEIYLMETIIKDDNWHSLYNNYII